MPPRSINKQGIQHPAISFKPLPKQVLTHRLLTHQSACLFLKLMEVKWNVYSCLISSSWNASIWLCVTQGNSLTLWCDFITCTHSHTLVHCTTDKNSGRLHHGTIKSVDAIIQPHILWMNTCTQFFWAHIQGWISWPLGCTKWLCRFTIHSSLRGFPLLCIPVSYTWYHRGAAALHFTDEQFFLFSHDFWLQDSFMKCLFFCILLSNI